MKRITPVLVYSLSWLALTVLSVKSYVAIFVRQCFFQSSTLFCSADVSTAQKIVSFAVVSLTLASFVWFGYYLWHRAEVLTGWKKFFLGLCLAMAVFVVPFGSSDMSYYFAAGREQARGLNIYTQQWQMEKDFVYPVPHDTITGFSYGPVIAWTFKILYQLSGGEIVRFMLLWKIIMLGSLLGCAALTVKLAQNFGGTMDKKLVAAIMLFQPMFVFEWVVNGHFDSLWLICVIAALIAAERKTWWLVMLMLTLGVWIKFIPAIASPLFVLWWWQSWSKETWRAQAVSTGIGLALSAALTVGAWAPYWHGFSVFGSVVIQSKWAVISWFAVLYYSLKPLFVVLFGGNAHWYLTRVAQGILVAALGYFVWPYLKQVWAIIVRRSTWEPKKYLQVLFVCLMAYLFIWQKSFLPWYGTWFLPFGIALYSSTKNEIYRRIVVWVSIAPFSYYVLWLGDWLVTRTDAGSELWFYFVVVGVVSVFPLYTIYELRKVDYKV